MKSCLYSRADSEAPGGDFGAALASAVGVAQAWPCDKLRAVGFTDIITAVGVRGKGGSEGRERNDGGGDDDGLHNGRGRLM